MAMSPRLLRPRAVGGFNPKQISGLAAWYDAADSASITIQTGVQQWSDKSGNGRNLVQNTTNNQPLHGSVTLNGKPAVTFDGSNDSLRVAFTLNQPYMMFSVWRLESYSSGSPRVFDGRPGSGSRSGEVFANGSLTSIALFAGAVLNLSPASPNSNAMLSFNVWDFTFNGATSSTRLRTSAATTTGNAGANNASGLTMGANGNATAGEFSNSSVAELVVFSRSLATSEADAVRKYLGTKWNLAYLS
jgi:hypothetical protein